jgi:hypothetical protein
MRTWAVGPPCEREEALTDPSTRSLRGPSRTDSPREHGGSWAAGVRCEFVSRRRLPLRGIREVRQVPLSQGRPSDGRRRVLDDEYSTKGNDISFTDQRGVDACLGPGRDTGGYRWKSFRKIDDSCDDGTRGLAGQEWEEGAGEPVRVAARVPAPHGLARHSPSTRLVLRPRRDAPDLGLQDRGLGPR